jgi:hypothetical protein
LQRRLPYVLARKGHASRGRAPEDVAHTFRDAADELPARHWTRITRRFRDGDTQCWWAAELTLFGYGPDKPVRAICATTDRHLLPDVSTWYLMTSLPADRTPLAEVVRLYGVRHWIEQSDKQMKEELGWADFMVRSDRVICRHWTLVCCAFAFCWWHDATEVRLHESVLPSTREKSNRRASRCAAAGRACCAR